MMLWDINEKQIKSLSEELKIGKKSVVQIAGSGGKTTLTYALAEENKCLKTVILTTTKRCAPKDGYLLKGGEIIDTSKINGNFSEIGVPDGNGKIGWVGDGNYDIIRSYADLVIIEADGAKRLPLKAAAEYEPVFVPDATHTIVVCGLSALGKPISEVCHRYNLIADKFTEDTIVTEDIIGYLLTEFYLKRFRHLRPIFILNQADSDELVQKGIKILKEFGLSGYVGALKGDKQVKVISSKP